jgi:hypothetical protein
MAWFQLPYGWAALNESERSLQLEELRLGETPTPLYELMDIEAYLDRFDRVTDGWDIAFMYGPKWPRYIAEWPAKRAAHAAWAAKQEEQA